MEQHCTQVGHEGKQILGMCINEKCPAENRTLCVACLQGIHANCMNQFLYTEQFINRLAEIKMKMQQQEENKIISLVAELTRKSYRFIQILQAFVNNIMTNYAKTNQITRIDEVLSKQNQLSTQNWNEGYKILTNQLSIPPQSTQILIESLCSIKQSAESIEQNQRQQIPIHSKKDTSPLNLQINAQNTIKSDWNNITPQKPLIIEAKHRIRTIALSPDGQYVASAGGGWGDCSIKIWNPITGKQVGNSMKGHKNAILSINYSKCGKYIVSGSCDGTIRRWNVQTQQQIDQPLNGHENSVTGVQYTPDQRYIVSCSSDKTIRFWIFETRQELVGKRIKHHNLILCMSLSPMSHDVAIGDDKGIITIYDCQRHQLSGESLKGHTDSIWSLQYSADGNYIVSGGDNKAILVWNAISRQQIASLIDCSVLSVSVSPDVRYVISGGGDSTVRTWDRVEGKQIGETLTHHKDWVCSTQFWYLRSRWVNDQARSLIDNHIKT